MASTSKSVSQFSRCCDPLTIHPGDLRRQGLRNPSAAMLEKLSFLKATDVVCSACRKKILASDVDVVPGTSTDIAPVQSSQEQPTLASEDTAVLASQETAFTTSESIVSSQATTSTSQKSSSDDTLVLSRVNLALHILGQSPIPCKKAKLSNWVSMKIDHICVDLKERLRCTAELPGSDKTALTEIINRLKMKYRDENTTRSEKIQILTVLPDCWSNAKISFEFGASLYMIREARELKLKDGVLATPKPKTGTALPETTVKEVIQFYEDDEVSVNMPGMKDFVSVVGPDVKRIHKQKRLLLANLKELYEHFKLMKPGFAVGFSKFASLRPQHCVSAGASGTHTSCVCIVHQNMTLLLIGCKVEKRTENSEHPIRNYEDCLNMLICSEPQSKCYFGTCTACPGIESLCEPLLKAFDDYEGDTLTYKQWITKPRTSLETIVKNTDDFIDEICDRLKRLLNQAFIAKHQAQYFKYLKSNLKDDKFLVICDFAENYAFVVQQAVSGFHWNNNQATIYPVVIYFRENGSLTHKSLVIVSDCLQHDAIAVHVFNKIVNDFITSICEQPKRVYYISDGAPQQFKHLKNFGNLYYHEQDFGVQAEWHFFASTHGKGPCDGVGGTIKRLAGRASLQLSLERQILTP